MGHRREKAAGLMERCSLRNWATKEDIGTYLNVLGTCFTLLCVVTCFPQKGFASNMILLGIITDSAIYFTF